MSYVGETKMTVDKQIELKKVADRDSKIKKSWRELEHMYSARDFKLGKDKGWQQEIEPTWQED